MIVFRTMDYGEGGPEYRIHFDVTYAWVEYPDCRPMRIDGTSCRADQPSADAHAGTAS
jgi:hypothetical protein